MALRADDVDLRRDYQLVERFQAGDDSAFDDLYRRYFDRLRRFCLRRVGDAHEAEEVAQEAFTRALRAMPTLGGERRFYPWMTVIASRLCVDSHRRTSRTVPVADVDLGFVDADHDDVFAEVDRAHLAHALAQLAPRHREVLRLREEQGWSYQRIAEHYDVTMGTVEALLHRARRALRREFEKVAGGRVGWAAVPGLAWAGRALDRLRTRVSSRAAELAEVTTPLAAKVASVAVAVGGAAILTSGPAATAPVPAAARARPAVVRSVAGSAAVVGVAPSAAPSSAGGAASTGARVPAVRVPAVQAPVAVGYQQAQGYNQQAPVRGKGLGTSVGADPSAVASDLAGHVTNVLDKVRRLP